MFGDFYDKEDIKAEELLVEKIKNIITTPMKWIEFTGFREMEEGTICKTKYDEFVIVGEMNTVMGTNDEFVEEITHYTEDKVDEIVKILKEAEIDFNNQT